MIILLKIILVVFSITSIVFGRLMFNEYKKFNKDIETKNTSLGERILINGIVIIAGAVLTSILFSCLIFIFSNITIETPF